MNAWKRLDERLSAGKGRTLWQFVKFNLVSLTVTILQLLLANLLPLAFDRIVSPLPPLLRGIFRAEALFPRMSAKRIARYTANPARVPLPRNVVFMLMK